MARTCSICSHTQSPEINEALVSGESHRTVAKRFEASESAMFRHQSEHLAAVVAKAASAQASMRDLMAGGDLVQKVHELLISANRITAAAEAAGDPRTALMGLREIARSIELVARLTGRIGGDQPPPSSRLGITINFPVASEADRQAAENAVTIDLPPMARRLLNRPSDGAQR